MVGVEPYLLPLAPGQKTRLVPDPVGHAGPAQVVKETCPADISDFVLAEAETGCGGFGEFCHSGRVAVGKGRFQVDHVGERPRYSVEAGL